MTDNNVTIELKIEAAVVLASLAKGSDQIIHSILEAGTLSILLKGNRKLVPC